MSPRPLLLALTLAALASAVPTSASAQWNTSDPGAWGAHRCQSRNIMQGGALLLMAGGAIASGADPRAEPGGVYAGLTMAGLGAVGFIGGIALRIRQPDRPGFANTYERWPSKRCSARAFIVRGSAALAMSVASLLRILVHPTRGRYGDRQKLYSVLVGVLPSLIVGSIQLGIGIRRLRRLGDRPPDPATTPLIGVPVGAQGTLGLSHRGASYSFAF